MRRFVEEYLERNGVLRQQLRTTVDMTSTEAIVSAVEAGIGIGFAPCMALEKALKLGSVKTVPLENGPIERDLSIVLLNGPEPKGPLGQLLQHLRARALLRRPTSAIGANNSTKVKQSMPQWCQEERAG
jgi:DNA-binding transcriptional LysR family regulator